MTSHLDLGALTMTSKKVVGNKAKINRICSELSKLKALVEDAAFEEAPPLVVSALQVDLRRTYYSARQLLSAYEGEEAYRVSNK